MPQLTISDLTVTYGRDEDAVTPLDRFALEVDEGKLGVLLGPSGCGKTTLLSCLSGIQRPTSGTIRFGDIEVTALDASQMNVYRRNTVGIVFQAFNLVPSMNATENVMVPLRACRVPRREAKDRAVTLLNDVGLGERVGHHPAKLSGGQQQRVAIARALAMNPPLIIADEPTASLDHVQVEVVLRILRGLTARGCSVIVSTHDPRLIPLADQVIEMQPHAAPAGAADRETSSEQHFAAGTTIFEQGSFGADIYEIVEGTVEFVQQRGDALALLGAMTAGEQFGEMGPVFDLPRSATARAVTDVDVIAHSVAAFRKKFGGEHLKQMIARYETGR